MLGVDLSSSRYYINLNETPPRTTYLHPDDEDPPSPLVVNTPLPPMDTIPPPPMNTIPPPPMNTIPPPPPPMNIIPPPPMNTIPPPPMNTIPSVPTLHRHVSMQGTTPFSNASQAYRARHPTLAQQLYASATTGQSTLPTPAHSDEELERDPGYRTNIALNGSPPEESNLFSISPNYGYRPNPLLDSSSSLPSPPLSPVWNYPPRRRPRGARSPSFPGPLPVTGPSFTLPPVNETQTASDLRERALFHSLPPTPSTLRNPQNITTFRHSRSNTLPSMKSLVAQPLPVGITSKPRETPMYSTFARPLETSPNPTKTTTPAFQNLSPLTAVTNIPAALPPFMLPVSPIAPNLQSNLQYGDTSQPITTSPVLDEVRDHQEAESALQKKVLKKVGLSVAKSAGKMVLRTGTKMALGSVGIPIDTSNMFSSDGDGVLSTITEGISEMAASAATAGVVSQALNAATSPSTTANMSPPHSLTTISRQPTLSTAPQPSMDPASYAAILNQMQAMQLTQHQQNNPSQPVHSPAEYASIISQMQAMQMPHGIQRPPLPSTSFSYQGVQPPSSPVTVSQVNGAQPPRPPQNGSAQGNWQQGLMNSIVGGATHALVSNAVNNINFSGAADAVTSTFSDFTSSFDPTE